MALFLISSFLEADFLETYEATIFSGSSSLSSSIFLNFLEALGFETDLAGELVALFLAGELVRLFLAGELFFLSPSSLSFEILTSLISEEFIQYYVSLRLSFKSFIKLLQFSLQVHQKLIWTKFR